MFQRSLRFFKPASKQSQRRRKNSRGISLEGTPFKRVVGNRNFPGNPANFREIIKNEAWFVDKSLFIKDVLDEGMASVEVIGAPSGSGKTINLSMLHHFITDYAGENYKENLFNHLKIKAYPDYMLYQGRYSAIFFTLHSANQPSFQAASKEIIGIFSALYKEHSYLLESKHLSSNDKYFYEAEVAQEN